MFEMKEHGFLDGRIRTALCILLQRHFLEPMGKAQIRSDFWRFEINLIARLLRGQPSERCTWHIDLSKSRTFLKAIRRYRSR
jgi:hypothetical protein